MTGLCYCGIAVVIVLGGKAGCVMAWDECSLFLFFSFSLFLLLLVLVFGVVRAQPCEHARYPRTPLRLPCCLLCCLLCFVLSSLLPAFLRASPFLLLWNGGV